jgi:hypothetical protein
LRRRGAQAVRRERSNGGKEGKRKTEKTLAEEKSTASVFV